MDVLLGRGVVEGEGDGGAEPEGAGAVGAYYSCREWLSDWLVE